jgi:hypothetical protein
MNRPALGPTQLHIARVSGALPPGVKWPGNEADHSFLLSVKFEWNCASSLSLCFHDIYGDSFSFCRENSPSVGHVYYVQMVCWPILFLPHVAESVVSLLLVVVGVVAEVIAVLLRGGAGGFVALVLLFVVVLMTVVVTVVVVLVKATFCVAWNVDKIWAFHTFEEDRELTWWVSGKAYCECKLSDFHIGVVVDFSLLGCDAMSLGQRFLMFPSSVTEYVLLEHLDPWRSEHNIPSKIRNHFPSDAASYPKKPWSSLLMHVASKVDTAKCVWNLSVSTSDVC